MTKIGVSRSGNVVTVFVGEDYYDSSWAMEKTHKTEASAKRAANKFASDFQYSLKALRKSFKEAYVSTSNCCYSKDGHKLGCYKLETMKNRIAWIRKTIRDF